MSESAGTCHCECAVCSINCFVGWHRWSKWQTTERGNVMGNKDALGLPPVTPLIVGTYEYQRRECEHCGKSQLREVGA